MRISTTVIVAGVAAILARGAGAVTIPDVLADPDAYDGQSIVLTGTVAEAIPVGSESGYNLRAGTLVITVVSRNAAPTTGTHLAVTGTVKAFKADDEGGLPPAFFESSRAVVP